MVGNGVSGGQGLLSHTLFQSNHRTTSTTTGKVKGPATAVIVTGVKAASKKKHQQIVVLCHLLLLLSDWCGTDGNEKQGLKHCPSPPTDSSVTMLHRLGKGCRFRRRVTVEFFGGNIKMYPAKQHQIYDNKNNNSTLVANDNNGYGRVMIMMRR